MSPIFTARPYPFALPEAQQLHQVLSELYPKANAASLIAARAGLNTAEIYWEQPIFYVWKEVLEKAAIWQRLHELVAESINLLPPGNPSAAFLEKLLSGKPLVLTSEPKAADGSPVFIRENDTVNEPEALLYHDDLTIQIGKVPKLISILQVLVRRAPSVCRLTVDFTGNSQYGTGFRIGERTLLTNWHVLHQKNTGTRAAAVTAEFGYEDNGQGGVLTTKNFVCDINSIVTDKANDWAIINAEQDLDPDWEVIDIKNTAVPLVQQPAYIIQHPRGDRKRLGFVRNQISSVDDQVIQYLTDTQEGSSGAPVFDETGHLIAVHHAGGRAQEVAGRPPIKKNEGIRISKILSDLRTKEIPGY